jgi:dTDP-4-dehydrorhamnose 3,5-epimerase-like enzyme
MDAGDGKLFYAPWWWARGFIAITDATVTYLCSASYNGAHEVAVNYRSFPEVEKLVSDYDVTIISEKDTISPLADKDALELWVKGAK